MSHGVVAAVAVVAARCAGVFLRNTAGPGLAQIALVDSLVRDCGGTTAMRLLNQATLLLQVGLGPSVALLPARMAHPRRGDLRAWLWLRLRRTCSS